VAIYNHDLRAITTFSHQTEFLHVVPHVRNIVQAISSKCPGNCPQLRFLYELVHPDRPATIYQVQPNITLREINYQLVQINLTPRHEAQAVSAFRKNESPTNKKNSTSAFDWTLV
jgi:hypothetical protein